MGNEKKRYELLEGLPAYGPMYIPISENGEPFYSEGIVVRFYKSDGTNWVANFEPGCTKFCKIFETIDENILFVCAGGVCYLMNPDITKPLKCFGSHYAYCYETPEKNFILEALTNFTFIGFNGNVWHSERISWDGFKDVKINGDILEGLSYDAMNRNDEWVPFTLNIKTKEITGGSYRKYNFGKPDGWD